MAGSRKRKAAADDDDGPAEAPPAPAAAAADAGADADAPAGKRKAPEEDDAEAPKRARGDGAQDVEMGDAAGGKGEEPAKEEKEEEEEEEKLPEEMARRREKIRQWQLKRRAELAAQEAERAVVEAATKRQWSLDDDDDVDDAPAGQAPAGQAPAQQAAADQGVDPLDAFMEDLMQGDNRPAEQFTVEGRKMDVAGTQLLPDDEAAAEAAAPVPDAEGEQVDDPELFNFAELLRDKQKGKIIPCLDANEGVEVRKDFYHAVPELANLTADEVQDLRAKQSIRVRGKNCPCPIRAWSQSGLSTKVLDALARLDFTKPTAIQAQALPALMSGRDIIGTAKTGSGKTLAFVLPMVRHILDQPDLRTGDGPIGLVMAPTRELAKQIHEEVRRIARPCNLATTCCYGGGAIAHQIGDLKRGVHIVVATPGRLIDVLSMNGGRVTNLKRMTYLVLDEADRLFDMGFERQITKVLDNARPDKQIALFSATFPRSVEVLARKALRKPIEIVVGGRSVVCSDIDQHVEVIAEDDKFKRLLQLLGEWYERGNILIFVDRQTTADHLFRDLIKAKYPCQSLHGKMDQTDRTAVLNDFKKGLVPLLIATSLAARGLDVKGLNLVVCYSVPDHIENYVHQVGRTGRAGRKGTSYTFITPYEDKYAPDLVQALRDAETDIPEPLMNLCLNFQAKKAKGLVKGRRSGFRGGRGYSFDAIEGSIKTLEMKKQMKELGMDVGDGQAHEPINTNVDVDALALATDSTASAAIIEAAQRQFQQQQPPQQPPPQPGQAPGGQDDAIARARAVAARLGVGPTTQMRPGPGALVVPPPPHAPGMGSMTGALVATGDGPGGARAGASANENVTTGIKTIDINGIPHHHEEITVNDFPKEARWKVLSKESIATISEVSGAALTAKGVFVAEGRQPPPGERKLYLLIESTNANCITRAKAEIFRILGDELERAGPRGGRGGFGGRYRDV